MLRASRVPQRLVLPISPARGRSPRAVRAAAAVHFGDPGHPGGDLLVAFLGSVLVAQVVEVHVGEAGEQPCPLPRVVHMVSAQRQPVRPDEE